MRVIFDHQIFSCQSHGGISRSHCLQALHLDGLEGAQCYIAAPAHRNLHLRALPKRLVLGGKYLQHSKDSVDTKWLLEENRQRSSQLLQDMQPDVLHETYYTGLPPISGPWRVIITIHDMTHEQHPGHCHPNDRTAQHKAMAVQHAHGIICPSEYTRSQILAHYAVSPRKVLTVPNGCALLSDSQAQGPSTEDALALPPALRSGAPFLLFVGHRSGFKNFNTLARALSGSRHLDDFYLLCIGGGAFAAQERALLNEIGLSGRVFSLPVCSDERLASLYRQAKALVYPSFCEGFGMPLVEAMLHDCSVLCARTTALPEVAGDAAAFFDPWSEQDIRQTLENVLLDEEALQNLRKAGRKRALLFSAERFARNTLSAYQALLKD